MSEIIKSAHEKKLDELNFLISRKVAEETLKGRIGCFGSLLCIDGSSICDQCADVQECRSEMEKTRQEQIFSLNHACTAKQPKVESEPTPAISEHVTEDIILPQKTTRKGSVDWAAAIAVVIKERPANYAELTNLLVDTLTAWGGLEPRRYKKFKDITLQLKNKGVIDFSDHKTDSFTWL